MLCHLPPFPSLWTTEVEVSELCFASVAPALWKAERQTLPLLTSLQELMGSGIVGYLHQFPLGRETRERRGEEKGGEVCFHRLLSIGLAGPSGTNIYIYDNEMPHFSFELRSAF